LEVVLSDTMIYQMFLDRLRWKLRDEVRSLSLATSNEIQMLHFQNVHANTTICFIERKRFNQRQFEGMSTF
jgi:hypothetical protein